GRAGPVRISKVRSERREDRWPVGSLDGRFHAVHHGGLALYGADVVSGIREGRAGLHGGACVYRVRCALVRHGTPPVYSVERGAGRVDVHRVRVALHHRRRLVLRRQRYPGGDRVHPAGTDLPLRARGPVLQFVRILEAAELLAVAERDLADVSHVRVHLELRERHALLGLTESCGGVDVRREICSTSSWRCLYGASFDSSWRLGTGTGERNAK